MKNEDRNERDVSGGRASPDPVDFSVRLEVAAKELKQLALSIRQAKKGSRSGPQRVLELLERTKNIFVEIRALEGECEAAAAKSRELDQRAWLELDSMVKEMCERRGWRIDGSWPSYIVAYGIQLEVDDKKRIVQVGNLRMDTNDIDAIETALVDQTKDLIPRDFAPESFLEALFVAYEDAKRGSPQVPLLDVYKALVIRSQRAGFWRNAKRERFVGLSIDQFRARLSRTVEANALRTKAGREVRFFPPLNPKDAVFLYNPIEGRLGFVGRLEFSGGLV